MFGKWSCGAIRPVEESPQAPGTYLLVIAYVVMAYIVMAYIVMAYVRMAYKGTPQVPLGTCLWGCRDGNIGMVT